MRLYVAFKKQTGAQIPGKLMHVADTLSKLYPKCPLPL